MPAEPGLKPASYAEAPVKNTALRPSCLFSWAMVEMYAPCWVSSMINFTPAFFILIMSGRNEVSVKLASRS